MEKHVSNDCEQPTMHSPVSPDHFNLALMQTYVNKEIKIIIIIYTNV